MLVPFIAFSFMTTLGLGEETKPFHISKGNHFITYLSRNRNGIFEVKGGSYFCETSCLNKDFETLPEGTCIAGTMKFRIRTEEVPCGWHSKQDNV